MVERSWNVEGGEVCYISTFEMVPLTYDMLHKSTFSDHQRI